MTGPLRALVVDDEPLARARLCRLLGAEAEVEVVASCASGEEAIQRMRLSRPDVVFLDVRMPGIDGFRTLAALPDPVRPHVVFVTAHAEHAVRAFDAEAVDYLLKPVSGERLHEAVQRVRRALAADRRMVPASAPAAGYPARLPVPVHGRLRLLAVAEIDHVLAQRNYVEIHAQGHSYLLREALTRLEERLDPGMFLRIHRSRLVRIDGVRDIEPLDHGQYLLRLACGARVRSGRNYRHRVREVFGLRATDPE